MGLIPRIETLDDGLFAASWALHQRARASGQHEVAYHALASAMHAADDSGNTEQVEAVRRRADEEQHRIDADQPTHRLATPQSGRGVNSHQTPLYAILVRTAAAMTARLAGAGAVKRAQEQQRP